jgi:hypothetical protein
MRILSAFALVLLAVVAGTGQPAEARDYPWCLVVQSTVGDGGETCLYETLDQCNASRAGGGNYCRENPAYWWGKPGYRGSRPWTYGPRQTR